MSYNCEILADSINPQGNRITTMKITFPRFILAEFNTHRMFSRNSASSRAIPFKKMVKMVEENPFIPIAWQKDHKGMQGTEYLDTLNSNIAKEHWLKARNNAILQATLLNRYGVTKQLCNRLLEPFMWHTVIVTATEWENFFKLRCPQYIINVGGSNDPSDDVIARSWKDLMSNPYTGDFDTDDYLEKMSYNQSQAEIHIQAIAELMWDAYNENTPKQLQAGEWHIPFGDNFDEKELHKLSSYKADYGGVHSSEITDYLKEQEIIKVKIAVARCARISYQTLGDDPKIDYEADIKLHDILAKSGHWSPFEHVAKAMNDEEYYKSFTKQEKLNNIKFGWCRNFKGFIQYRSLMDF